MTTLKVKDHIAIFSTNIVNLLVDGQVKEIDHTDLAHQLGLCLLKVADQEEVPAEVLTVGYGGPVAALGLLLQLEDDYTTFLPLVGFLDSAREDVIGVVSCPTR